MAGKQPRYMDEILTDNTQIKYCEQCRKCIMWDKNGDPFMNRYDKANCLMYPNPDHKPGYVINNEGVCPYRSEG